MELKEWIKAARARKGWTQTQLGEVVSVTKGNVSSWEKGRHEPSYSQLLKIAEATGFPLGTETLESRMPSVWVAKGLGKTSAALPIMNAAMGSGRSILIVTDRLKELTLTRREIVGNLLLRLALDPDNKEIAEELELLLDRQTQQTAAAKSRSNPVIMFRHAIKQPMIPTKWELGGARIFQFKAPEKSK